VGSVRLGPVGSAPPRLHRTALQRTTLRQSNRATGVAKSYYEIPDAVERLNGQRVDETTGQRMIDACLKDMAADQRN